MKVDEVYLSLEKSDSGTYFIEMSDMGRLIFSRTLQNSHGYKWLCYLRKYYDTIDIKNTGGERQIVSIPEQDNIVYNLKLYRDLANTWGVKKGTIHPKVQKWLRKTFERLGNEIDGILYFPESKMDELKELIDQTNFNKMVHPKKKKAVENV